MSFNEDLPFGQLAENKTALYYQNAGFRIERSLGAVKEWDMVISQGVEVKYDRQALKTSNYAFEIKCRGNPSGLSTTKARLWVLCTDEGAWEAEVETLKRWVKDYGTKRDGSLQIIKGGDDLQSDLILVDYNLVKQFKRLW
jgi:hypothetical protein